MKPSNPVFSGYRVTAQIHDDANSLGFKAVRLQDGLPVVLRMLKPVQITPMALSRFHNEYEITRLLKTDRIIKVLDLVSHEQIYFIVYEDFDGTRLDEFMRQWRKSAKGALPLLTFLEIAVRIVESLADIHAAGVIYKDLHPSGIVYNAGTGMLKISDFGLATALNRENPDSRNLPALKGALAYMSPEQTGRVNRMVDYRTDFYSLGVIFYEMLAGRLPFDTTDAMELVHAHLARTPVNPRVFNPSIPSVLCDLVLKLMAKAPEDRYRSARGIKQDLARCLLQLEDLGEIQGFELGRQDQAERFLIPEKLYGRTMEIDSLLKAFDRAAQGRAELLLVAGFPGIGKTAVINEIQKPIAQRHGYFIRGRFDPYKHDTPFSAFVAACRDLMGRWLSEGGARLEQRKDRILEALGNTGQIIIDIIPELERIIGSQPPVPDLPGSASRNRFNILFQKFVTALSSQEHPLAIFLDDMQWADEASLELMRLLIGRNDLNHLLILGAYRDNEVSSSHPLSRTMIGLEKTGTPIRILSLTPLHISDINQLIADALGCSTEKALPLTDLVYRITKGNPFFNNQLLSSLYEEGLIIFDREAGHWNYELSKVNKLSLTDDVVEFLAIQLQKLPASTQEVLKLAACFGSSFDLGTLASICRLSRIETVSNLWTAMQAGIILPLSAIAGILPPGSGDAGNALDALLPVPFYGFIDERVQQAAYSLIPPDQRKAIHLMIARTLLTTAPLAEREQKLFEIVNQFNRGKDLVAGPAELQELAELNLLAGQRAKTAIAYRAALDYFEIARQSLPKDCWQSQYAFALNLYESSMETAFLNGDYETAEELGDIALKNAKTPFDQIRTYECVNQAFTAQGKFEESLDVGFRILGALGVSYPRKPTQNDIDVALQEVKSAYSVENIEALAGLPLMKDSNKLAIARILAGISFAAFYTSPELYAFLALKDVHLAMVYGNTPDASFSYATYGQILCRGEDGAADPDLGYRFGRLGMDLLHGMNAKELQCKVPSIVHAFVWHWKVHVREMLVPLRSAYSKGIEIGDFQYASYSAYLYCAFSYFAGIAEDLSELQREAAPLSESMRQIKQVMVHGYFRMLQQAMHDLGEGDGSGRFLAGEYFDEERMLQRREQLDDWIGLFYIHFHKMLLHYLFGNYSQAIESANRAKSFLRGMMDFPYLPIFHLYESLAHLAAQRETPECRSEEVLYLIDANQEKMKAWAQSAPMNCLHKYNLVEAERCRNCGDQVGAIEEYDRAIAGAKKSGYFREEALANELAATFFLDCGREKVARIYMEEARRCYARWGAHAKVAQMERRCKELPAPILSGTGRESGLSDRSRTGRSRSIEGLTDTPLDLTTVVKASQAMSSNIELAPLLTKLMRIVIENAGAQRGALILEGDGNWVIEAQGDAEGKEFSVLQSQNLNTSGAVPAQIVYRVAQTRTNIVLGNASADGDFARDPYIVQHGVKSLLCTPLINQGKLSAIVYLENNLTAYAFTTERLELLNLLSAQIALSLDNARLYQKAQEEIAERKQAETALRASEQRALAIFDSVNDAIIVHEVDTGKILDVNRTACEMYGYTHEEILQLDILDLSLTDPARSFDDVQMRYDRAYEGRRQIFEWKAKDKRGRIFWVEVNAKLTVIGGSQRVLVVVRNIEERKRMEAAFHSSESVLRATMESISDGLLVVAEDGSILHCNSRFYEIWSIPETLRSSRQDNSLLEYVPQQLADPKQFLDGAAKTYQFSARTEDVLHLKDGRIIERFAYPLKRAGKASAIVWLFRDVTERIRSLERIRRMNEELEERVAERTAEHEATNRELESFTYSVSHDLRAPLRAIDGYARIIIGDYAQSLNDEGKRFCRVIRSQAQRMSKLIDDLLAFSRLNRASLNFESIDMESLAHTVFAEISTNEQKRKIDFRITALSPAVGDRTLLRQVWINLLSNAVKFTDRQKHPVIEVTSMQKDAATVYSVRDNGAGFDMRYGDKLFGVFQRLHSESEFEGTGVGLAIVQRIIYRHGGTVWAEGEVGKGAAFFFSLPHKEMQA
jgi:PAS domain S-box-containing protein